MEGTSWEGLYWIGEVAFRHLWQSLLITAIISVLLFKKNLWSAEHRSWIWTGGVILMGTLPILTLIPLPTFKFLASSRPAAVDQGQSISMLLNQMYHYDAEYILPVTQNVGSSFLASPPFLFGILFFWFCLSGWALFKLYTAWHRTRQLLDNATPVATEEAFVPAGWPEHITIASSDEITGPMTAGLLRSTVLLPSHLLDTLSPAQIHHVLAHELAHIERGDLRFAFLQRLLLSIYWWNPLMHIACKELRAEREMACDDRAVKKTGCSKNYATSLIDSAEALFGDVPTTKELVAIGAFERKGEKSFTTRIRRLIGRDYASSIRLSAVHSIGLIGATAFAASIFLLTPRTAFSETMPMDPEACCVELIQAIASKDHVKFKELLKKDADVNCYVKDYGTPMVAAAKAGDVGMVKYLTKAGADLNKPGKKKLTPLIAAVAYGNGDTMKKLIALGADVDTASGNYTPLIMAAHKGDYDAVKYLVSKGADVTVGVKTKDGKYLTPLGKAKEQGHTKVAKYLHKKVKQAKETGW
jgi:beta-lactamase regulating signal transducer with metallopeptidase domain